MIDNKCCSEWVISLALLPVTSEKYDYDWNTTENTHQ